MTALLIIAFIVILLALKGMSQRRAGLEEESRRLKESFGSFSKREYGAEEYLKIKSSGFFAGKGKKEGEEESRIDDITWTDINLDEVYKKINISCSQMGDEYLYEMLRRPVHDREILEERGRIAEILRKNGDLRLELMRSLKNTGRLSGSGLNRMLSKLDEVRVENNIIHYLCVFTALITIVFIFVRPVIGFVLTFIVLIFNVATYFRRKGEIDEQLNAFAYIFGILWQAKFLMEINAPELEKYTGRIGKTVEHFKKITRGSFVMMAGRSLTGNLLSLPLDYLRIILHLDLIKFNDSLKFVSENRDELRELMETEGFLDACISIASLRETLKTWCVPYIYAGEGHELELKGLYHPLIEEPVPYDIRVNKGVLITGSNASGKSTFLRATALAVILGQTLYTVPAKKASFSRFKIYSSMAVTDSLVSGESLYMAEIRAIKRIMDAAGNNKDGICVLAFMDEILRGTNTIERIAGASRILKGLSDRGALIFAATHDTELTDILADILDNYHFSEVVEGKEIRFTYELDEGAALTRNAIALLIMMEFDDALTDDATKAAIEFEKTKVWNRL